MSALTEEVFNKINTHKGIEVKNNNKIYSKQTNQNLIISRE